MSNARTLASTINSSSQIVVPSGGVNFGTGTDGTGTVTSGVLDDYEEGTWTPTNYTLNAGGVATGLRYTKIGRLVTVSCYFANVTFSGITIGGLPFASLGYGVGSIAYSDSTNVDGITSINDTIQFRQSTGSVTPDGNYMMLSVTYQCSV